MAVGVGNILRVASVWTFDGVDEQVNVLHLRVVANGTADDTEALADIAEFMGDAYAGTVGVISNFVDHNRLQVQNITQGLVYGSLPGNSALNGSEGSDPMPPQNTILLLMNTLLSRVQGRIYLPTTGEAHNSKGDVSATAISGAGALGTYLMASHAMTNGLELRYIVYSPPSAFNVPQSFRVVPRFRIQRRRAAGRGS